MLDAEEQVLEKFKQHYSYECQQQSIKFRQSCPLESEYLITVNGFALPIHGLMDFGLCRTGLIGLPI